MNFYVGQKVVCVDARSPVIRGHQNELRCLAEGSEYLIAAARVDPWTQIPAVQIEGIPEWIWVQARRFRPVVERKTDISIFTRMLGPAPNEKVRA